MDLIVMSDFEIIGFYRNAITEDQRWWWRTICVSGGHD